MLILGASFILTARAYKVLAYPQGSEVCYSQCATYKFVWQGDYCWDMFQQNCSVGTGASVRKAISLIKEAADAARKGDIGSFSVDTVFTAWFVCKPLIENCIAPQLSSCRSTCNYDQYYYAPNLSVGSPYANFAYHGVLYNDAAKTLTFKVVNNGKGYAWDIEAEASWGHTRNRDGQVSGGGQLFQETIPELIYAGARNGPPDTLGDIVTDFLIDESNFSEYLQGFKSDADNYNVPPVWYKTIPFTPPEGELTKVIFNVDPSQMIPERNESDNTFVLVIDKLPTPARFKVDDFEQRLISGSMTDFMIDFTVKNTGEENGQARVRVYEGDFATNKEPIYESNQVIQGLNQFNFGTIIKVAPASSDYCGITKKYTMVVTDESGVKVEWTFSLPIYVGSINGRVEDLFGHPVEGAMVSTNTGQTALVNQYGSYHLKGITALGQIVVSVTHPEYSQVASQSVEMKVDGEADPCIEGNLTFSQVDFVLKDQDVLFTIMVKDSWGNPIEAHVLATNADWRFEADVNGEGLLPGMQPGEYQFTVSAGGYKTVSQNMSAVPNGAQLEFVLEPLYGRLTDGGLTIDNLELLWQMDLGEEIFTRMTATKDGKVVMVYTDRSQPNTGKLYFLDLINGNQRAVVNTAASGGNSQSALDTSYDGNTTALLVHINKTTQSERANKLFLFNNLGTSIGQIDLNPQKSGSLCEVSPDGFWVYPFQLLNKGLYQYTNREILGDEHNNDPMTYSAGSGFHWTTANNKVAGCSRGGGQCVESLRKGVVASLGKIEGVSRQTDSSQDGTKVAMITDMKAYLFGGGAKIWEKEIDVHGDQAAISISPGGKMVIYSTVNPDEPYRSIKIFSDSNVDKTPPGSQTGKNEDVVFVHANDAGIFYATKDQKQLKFYQVGNFTSEYKPPTPPPTIRPPLYVHGLSYWDNGVFRDVGGVVYYQLQPYTIYLANQTVYFDMMDPYGTLKILEGTLFGVDVHHHPIVLKGQITASFNSPAHVYAIKFDRYDMDLFATKLNQMANGNLASDEYFEVTNIHTKWIVTNQPNQIQIAVAAGQVQILGQDFDQVVGAAHKAVINQDNQLKISYYITGKIYLVGFTVLMVIAGGVLGYYRNTVVGRKIIKILLKWLSLGVGWFKALLKALWSLICKLVQLLVWGGLKLIKAVYCLLKRLVTKLVTR